MIRVSAVSYTNTVPFIYGLEQTEIKKELILSLDVPAVCAQKLRNNIVDIGLIPVAELFSMPNASIIGDYCIGADGAVNSVFIFSNCLIEEVKFLQLDPQSRSSNALAQVLLNNHWHLKPQLISNANDYGISEDEHTAFVQIGDRTFGQINKHKYVYDLAATWKDFTGLPFVFAVWVCNKNISRGFIKRFNEALKFGLDNRLTIFENLPTYKDFDLVDYLMHKIDYNFSPSKKEALNLFKYYVKLL